MPISGSEPASKCEPNQKLDLILTAMQIAVEVEVRDALRGHALRVEPARELCEELVRDQGACRVRDDDHRVLTLAASQLAELERSSAETLGPGS